MTVIHFNFVMKVLCLKACVNLVKVHTENSGLLVCDAVWWVKCNTNLPRFTFLWLLEPEYRGTKILRNIGKDPNDTASHPS